MQEQCSSNDSFVYLLCVHNEKLKQYSKAQGDSTVVEVYTISCIYGSTVTHAILQRLKLFQDLTNEGIHAVTAINAQTASPSKADLVTLPY